MSIFYLNESSLEDLKANIKANEKRYVLPAAWLKEYFGDESWHFPTDINMDKDVQLKPPSGPKDLGDYENTVALYSAMKDLTPAQATEERLWAFLTHITFWEYMRNRWSAEDYIGNPRIAELIREHYFFSPEINKRLIRNGISRLWWYGYLTYDSSRGNPFELTQLLLSKLDIAQQLLERNFSRNRNITRTILSVLTDRTKKGKVFPNREKFRTIMRYLNNMGGVTILDALSEEDIEKIVVGRLEKSN